MSGPSSRETMALDLPVTYEGISFRRPFLSAAGRSYAKTGGVPCLRLARRNLPPAGWGDPMPRCELTLARAPTTLNITSLIGGLRFLLALLVLGVILRSPAETSLSR